MNNSFALRCLLLLILSIHIFTPVNAQKDTKEFPKAKVMTGEELQRLENERKQNEEFQKKQETEQTAWAKKYRIDEYPGILLSDIFKFGFSITVLLAIAICLVKRRPKGLEYYLPLLILIGLYLLHCSLYSQKEEFRDCFISGIEAFLVTTLFSVCMISAFVNVISKAQGFTNYQKVFTVIVTVLSTAFIAFLLTSNIEVGSSDKSSFILYPWNWLGFLIINSYFSYNLKLVKIS